MDALIDSLKIVPLLFLAHIVIELIEKVSSDKFYRCLRGKLAPLIGTGVGLLPQCGFSVVATNLFAARRITVGTLLAVYISTSDEALPILLSNPAAAPKILPLLLIKAVLALVAGYGAELLLRKPGALPTVLTNEKHGAVGCHHHEIGEEEEDKARGFFHNYVLHPLVHTLTVFAFILAVNIVFGVVVYYVTPQRLAAFMDNIEFAQPFLAALVGLIPNCASSVIITQMFALGHLTLGGAVAGLGVNAGLGLAVLFKENKNLKANLLIVIFMYLFCTLAGVLLTAIV